MFFTTHADIVYLRDALKAGATGYVLKTSPLDELRTAIEAVLADGIYICSMFGRDALPNLQTRTGKLTRSSAHLSERQREILQLITEGQSNKEIAAILGISVKTVDFHRARVMQTLGVHTAAELAVAAILNRLVVESEPLVNGAEILQARALDSLWRTRLSDAKFRLDQASRHLEEVHDDLQPAASPSDGSYALRKAVVAERAALREYRRLQRIYQGLGAPGNLPDAAQGPKE